MRSYLYNGTDYSPPAPVIPITVQRRREPDTGIEVEALIDTGADATILPLALLRQVRADEAGTHRWRTVTGRSEVVSLFLVTLKIAGHTVYGIRAVGATFATEPILGRDVLNQLLTTLDGMGETTEIA